MQKLFETRSPPTSCSLFGEHHNSIIRIPVSDRIPGGRAGL
jgi:hypothetical protein